MSLLVPAVTAVAFHSAGGGLALPLPATAACDPQVFTYGVAIATKTLSWDRCDVVTIGRTGSAYSPSKGNRVLSATEFQSVTTALSAVHVSDGTGCGADKPAWTIAVSTPHGTLTYGDEFYACNKQYRHYVGSEGLDALYGVISRLVPAPAGGS